MNEQATAPDPRLEEIESRLSKATPGPWEVFGSLSQWETEEGLSFGPDNAPEVGTVTEGLGDANFIAHSPADVAYLLAELRKAQDKLARVEALAEKWRYKGEYGYGAWQEGYGPDHEGYLLDNVSGELRAAVADATGGECG